MLPLNAKEKFEELGSDNNDAREHNSQYQRPRWTAPLRPHIAAERAAEKEKQSGLATPPPDLGGQE